MRPLAFVLWIGVAGGALALPAAPAQAGPEEAECSALAKSRIAGWQAAGLPADEIQRRYRLAVVACASPAVDSNTAVFMGQMNFDYYRLAQLLVTKKIGSGEYEYRLRDRARKRGLVRTRAGFLTDWIAGDADGDFIADARDYCPGTKDLEPTDDRGCPSAYRPPGYGPDPIIYDLLDKMGVMRSLACDGAPHTAMPTPLSLTIDAAGALHILVSRVNNQPAGCEVFYEISSDSWRAWRGPGGPTVSHVVLRSSEDVGTDPERAEFVLDWNETGERLNLLVNVFNSFHTTWRVRAVNGNGLASDYSRPLRSPR